MITPTPQQRLAALKNEIAQAIIFEAPDAQLEPLIDRYLNERRKASKEKAARARF